VETIDQAKRVVNIKTATGEFVAIDVPEGAKRFNEIKVGDKVTFRYHESLVTAIHKPGTTKPADSAAITRTPGARPGGTISQQMTAVVTLEAIDAKVPSVTIRTAGGRRMSFKIEHAKNLEGYKAGDKVEITYTEAVAVSVAAAGK